MPLFVQFRFSVQKNLFCFCFVLFYHWSLIVIATCCWDLLLYDLLRAAAALIPMMMTYWKWKPFGCVLNDITLCDILLLFWRSHRMARDRLQRRKKLNVKSLNPPRKKEKMLEIQIVFGFNQINPEKRFTSPSTYMTRWWWRTKNSSQKYWWLYI
jgi:hypothetical protein